MIALSPYAQGVLTPFAVIGALLVVAGLVWLAMVAWPEIVWWTVKRLSLTPDYRRDNSAAVVGGARKAWCLRIPYGIRVIVALGGTRVEHEAYADLIRLGRVAEKERADQVAVATGSNPSDGDV
jgi:hypothetical protein